MLIVFLFIFSFFRTLLFFVVLFLAIRWIKKIFTAPANSSKQHSTQADKAKEGETTIRFNDKGEKIVDKDKGEYVEFEEVD